MALKISIYTVLLFILTLTFANMYAETKDLTPITDIMLNSDYETNEDYFDDFCQKSNASGKLFFGGLFSFMGFIPGVVEDVRDAINFTGDVITGIWDWLGEFISRFIMPNPIFP